MYLSSYLQFTVLHAWKVSVSCCSIFIFRNSGDVERSIQNILLKREYVNI